MMSFVWVLYVSNSIRGGNVNQLLGWSIYGPDGPHILVKAPPRVQYGKKIAQECGRETNAARGEVECCIRLKTTPECYFFHIAQVWRCFNWFKVLSSYLCLECSWSSAIRQSVSVYIVQVWS